MGNTGPYPARVLKSPPSNDSEAGPGTPCRGVEWVVIACGVGGPQNPPSGPGRSLQALPGSGTLGCRLWANKARFSVFLLKLSQNGVVSPEKCNKASHSPCFQKRLRKSALEIPGFPFLSAFSHKELMVLFWAGADFTVKMTKCRQNAHTRGGRRYPHGRVSKLTPATAPHLLSAGPA